MIKLSEKLLKEMLMAIQKNKILIKHKMHLNIHKMFRLDLVNQDQWLNNQ